MRENWKSALQYPPGALPLLMATIARNLGRADQTERRQTVESGLAKELDALAPSDRERFLTVVQALVSSPGCVAFLRTGAQPEESAEVLIWMLRTLHEALRVDEPRDG